VSHTLNVSYQLRSKAASGGYDVIMSQNRQLPIKHHAYALIVRPAARLATVAIIFGAVAMAGGFLIKGSSWTSDAHLCGTLGSGILMGPAIFFSQLSDTDWRRRKQLVDPNFLKWFLTWSILILVAIQFHWHAVPNIVSIFGFTTLAAFLATIYKFLSLAGHQTDGSQV
jgi:hypothetical protein